MYWDEEYQDKEMYNWYKKLMQIRKAHACIVEGEMIETMDGDGNVFIKGRSKNMLLGANGQNIYPEELEDKLNSLALVAESVVVQKGDKLIALVHPDYDEAQTLLSLIHI